MLSVTHKWLSTFANHCVLSFTNQLLSSFASSVNYPSLSNDFHPLPTTAYYPSLINDYYPLLTNVCYLSPANNYHPLPFTCTVCHQQVTAILGQLLFSTIIHWPITIIVCLPLYTLSITNQWLSSFMNNSMLSFTNQWLLSFANYCVLSGHQPMTIIIC